MYGTTGTTRLNSAVSAMTTAAAASARRARSAAGSEYDPSSARRLVTVRAVKMVSATNRCAA
jgi:hypothetical protein